MKPSRRGQMQHSLFDENQQLRAENARLQRQLDELTAWIQNQQQAARQAVERQRLVEKWTGARR